MLSTTNRWLLFVENLMINGTRLDDTYELLGSTFPYETADCIINSTARKINYRFMAAEAAYILSGRNDIQYLSEILPKFENYSDDGVYQAGAYGPKVVDQLPYVINCLENHRHSRQAVINIWRERPFASVDIPCTLSMQFLIRDDVLNTVVSMRSSDAFTGLIYDTFCFGAISAAVAGLMDAELGMTHIHMGSSHLYNKDVNEADKVVMNPGGILKGYKLKPGLPTELISWLELVKGSDHPLRELCCVESDSNDGDS